MRQLALLPIVVAVGCSSLSAPPPPLREQGMAPLVADAELEVKGTDDRNISMASSLPPTPSPNFDEQAPAPTSAYGCTLQRPQDFLKRSSYTSISSTPNPERQAAHHRAIAYRTRAYGYVEGFGDESANPIPPKDYLYTGTFFGIPVSMNNRVMSALQCVEAAIQAECTDDYHPEVVEGFRTQNKFHNNEISNHAYGIAIDLDFHLNPCCGCIAEISDRPLCKRPASAYERTVIPRCWIDTFERFGFYWLGHDVLEDTMHFEFLGDPDRIVAGP